MVSRRIFFFCVARSLSEKDIWGILNKSKREKVIVEMSMCKVVGSEKGQRKGWNVAKGKEREKEKER